MSTAPPMQPPWMAASTGMRACSSTLKVPCNCRAVSRSWARRRPCSVERAAPSEGRSRSLNAPPPVKTDRSIPAEKCLPVDEITMARARPSALIARTISGSSVQNSGIIELS